MAAKLLNQYERERAATIATFVTIVLLVAVACLLVAAMLCWPVGMVGFVVVLPLSAGLVHIGATWWGMRAIWYGIRHRRSQL